MSTKKEKWVVFRLDGEELMRINAKGADAWRLQSTKGMLSVKYGCSEEAIKAELVEADK